MNRILSFAISIIVLILTFEAGYYFGIKGNNFKPGNLFEASPNVAKDQKLLTVASPTPESESSINIKNLITQKSSNLMKTGKTITQDVSSGDINKALKDLISIAALKAEIDRLNYRLTNPDYFPALMSVPKDFETAGNNNYPADFISDLKKADTNSLTSSSNRNLAKLFYRLGLTAYRADRKDLTIPLWVSMVNLSPEWSHFQLEMANYYLSENNIQASKDAINYCRNFSFPEDLCVSFLLNEINNVKPHPVGFMEEKIMTEIKDN